MIIPPYFPEPKQVKNNVETASYDQRLRFLRIVHALNFLGTIFAGSVALASPLPLDWKKHGLCLLILVLALSGVRRILAGNRLELLVSLLLALPTLTFAGLFFRDLERLGWPTWSLPYVVFGSSFYMLICGRDFSFVGQYFLSLIFSVLTALVIYPLVPGAETNFALGLGLLPVIQLYYSYDMAMVLRRRRIDEPACAVTDLYCDFLNFTTYPIRVAQHWRSYRRARPTSDGT